MSAVFEWRSEYKADLVENKEGNLEVVTIITTVNLILLFIIIASKVITTHPSASVGLYHHYNVKVVMKRKKTILTGVFLKMTVRGTMVHF